MPITPGRLCRDDSSLAFLFEYAATLGLIDVAYIAPAGSRNDFHDRWGTDELSCLSRYDGLMFLRINSLGAWCLGMADRYEPEAFVVERVLKTLPNLDVVASHPPLSPADVLFLDRFAERKSEAVWHLSTAKVLEAVEEGLTVGELRAFLVAKSQESLAQTVMVFSTMWKQGRATRRPRYCPADRLQGQHRRPDTGKRPQAPQSVPAGG